MRIGATGVPRPTSNRSHARPRLGYPDGNACEDAGRQDERRNRAGVSEADGCDYCLDAHSFTAGKLAKIPADEIELNRECRWGDPKRQAAVAFAKALIETRGKVSDAQFAAVRDVGWTDANIVEMTALTAQFLLTNFMNNAVQTPIDFPEVSPAK